jgi:hypothetical protein
MLHRNTDKATPPRQRKTVTMSQQLTLSSLFCVLALAGLCVVTSARELSGYHTPVVAEQAALTSDSLQG